ncbi:MAG: hypothetical protein JXR37_30310 [Kiritimatiellae bacterium]|nr:hypothetical protein [Kiritimatiellia bacterium]
MRFFILTALLAAGCAAYGAPYALSNVHDTLEGRIPLPDMDFHVPLDTNEWLSAEQETDHLGTLAVYLRVSGSMGGVMASNALDGTAVLDFFDVPGDAELWFSGYASNVVGMDLTLSNLYAEWKVVVYKDDPKETERSGGLEVDPVQMAPTTNCAGYLLDAPVQLAASLAQIGLVSTGFSMGGGVLPEISVDIAAYLDVGLQNEVAGTNIEADVGTSLLSLVPSAWTAELERVNVPVDAGDNAVYVRQTAQTTLTSMDLILTPVAYFDVQAITRSNRVEIVPTNIVVYSSRDVAFSSFPRADFTFTFVTGIDLGALHVAIQPQKAVDAAAQWALAHDGVWRDSGQTVSNLAAGEHTVQFKDIELWNEPADTTVRVPADGQTNVVVDFVAVPVFTGFDYEGGVLSVTVSNLDAYTAFVIEDAGDLTEATWGSNTIDNSGAADVVTTNLTGTATSRFYRVRVDP